MAAFSAHVHMTAQRFGATGANIAYGLVLDRREEVVFRVDRTPLPEYIGHFNDRLLSPPPSVALAGRRHHRRLSQTATFFGTQ